MDKLNLPKKYNYLLEDFKNNLERRYANGLVSVILYGSAASGEFVNKHSNINLLVVLNDTSLGNLSKSIDLLNSNKFRLLTPIFFTEDYIGNSTDTFPIEFLDMKENYSVLFGKDVLRDIQIDVRNLRFQCEQELKSKIIQIKNFYLKHNNKADLKILLFKSFTSVLHILRNLVRLKGKDPLYLKMESLSQLAGEFSIDQNCFEKILNAKNKNTNISYKETKELFFNFVDELEKIITAIDKL